MLDGETFTSDPLIAVIFPGAMMPEPFVNFAKRVVVPPVVTAGGFAVKLVITGDAAAKVLIDPFPQPVKLAIHRLDISARTVKVVARVIKAPVTKATESTQTL